MKKFTINCDFGGQMSPFTIYIGSPKEGNHPLDNQAKWLSDNRGGTIPGEVMEAVSKLQELAKKNNVSLEELCVYALGTEEEQAALAAEKGLANEDEVEDDRASDEAIQADNEGAESGFVDEDEIEHSADDMAEEGGHVVDSEIDEEDAAIAEKEKKE